MTAFGFGSAAALVAFLPGLLSIGWRRTFEERGLICLSLPPLFVVGPLVFWAGVRLLEEAVELVFFRPWFSGERHRGSPPEATMVDDEPD